MPWDSHRKSSLSFLLFSEEEKDLLQRLQWIDKVLVVRFLSELESDFYLYFHKYFANLFSSK